jgi:hypothetical protein
MNRLLRDSVLASAIREAARRRIGELFSMHASIRQVEDLYLKMIESPKTYLAEAAVP